MRDEYDARTARAARDEAIATVDEHAEEIWKLAALDVVYELARERDYFTTDAVWYLLDKRGIDPPHEERALGAVMRKAQIRGWIESTDRTKKSVRRRCHARDLRVWHGLIEVAHA
jgi:hypothetical protein